MLRERKGSLVELLSSKIYTTNLTVMMIIWSFGSFAFFLVPYYLQNLSQSVENGPDIFTLSLVTEVAEFLASVACIFITRIVSLK